MENERIPYRACPLCQSPEIHKLITVDCTGYGMWHEPLEPTMSWVQCGQCQHVFTEGYFTDEAFKELWGNTIHQTIVSGNELERNRNISAKMVERVVNATGLPNNLLWLDVGFGNGSLLMTAKEFGFDAFGIDLLGTVVEDIRKMGVSAYCGTLEDAINNVTLARKPGVISMADVVEHEPFPLTVLRDTRKLIQDGGILLISMPNASAPLWHDWNATGQNPYWQEMNHYHNFTREKLYAVLKQTGFEPFHYNISERYRCCMEVLAKAV